MWYSGVQSVSAIAWQSSARPLASWLRTVTFEKHPGNFDIFSPYDPYNQFAALPPQKLVEHATISAPHAQKSVKHWLLRRCGSRAPVCMGLFDAVWSFVSLVWRSGCWLWLAPAAVPTALHQFRLYCLDPPPALRSIWYRSVHLHIVDVVPSSGPIESVYVCQWVASVVLGMPYPSAANADCRKGRDTGKIRVLAQHIGRGVRPPQSAELSRYDSLSGIVSQSSAVTVAILLFENRHFCLFRTVTVCWPLSCCADAAGSWCSHLAYTSVCVIP